MTKDQINAIFASIKPRAGVPPYKVSVLMTSGQLFSGMAYPTDANGMVRLDVERIADAHLTKPPMTIWLQADAIEVITEDGILVPPPPLVATAREGQTGETVQTDEPVKL